MTKTKISKSFIVTLVHCFILLINLITGNLDNSRSCCSFGGQEIAEDVQDKVSEAQEGNFAAQKIAAEMQNELLSEQEIAAEVQNEARVEVQNEVFFQEETDAEKQNDAWVNHQVPFPDLEGNLPVQNEVVISVQLSEEQRLNLAVHQHLIDQSFESIQEVPCSQENVDLSEFFTCSPQRNQQTASEEISLLGLDNKRKDSEDQISQEQEHQSDFFCAQTQHKQQKCAEENEYDSVTIDNSALQKMLQDQDIVSTSTEQFGKTIAKEKSSFSAKQAEINATLSTYYKNHKGFFFVHKKVESSAIGKSKNFCDTCKEYLWDFDTNTKVVFPQPTNGDRQCGHSICFVCMIDKLLVYLVGGKDKKTRSRNKMGCSRCGAPFYSLQSDKWDPELRNLVTDVVVLVLPYSWHWTVAQNRQTHEKYVPQSCLRDQVCKIMGHIYETVGLGFGFEKQLLDYETFVNQKPPSGSCNNKRKKGKMTKVNK